MATTARVPFFDAHCHLQDPRLRHCIEDVLKTCQKEGLRYLSCNGTNEKDWTQVQELAKAHCEILPNYGLHPWYVHERSPGWRDGLERVLESSPTAGLGECGLDFGPRNAQNSHEDQIHIFQQQLQLARKLHRPVSVHCVKAFGQLQEIVQHEGGFPAGCVLHSWAGSAEVTRQLARIPGVFFSLSGHTLGLSERKLTLMLQQVPLDRLLLETDSPDGLQGLSGRPSLAPYLVPVTGVPSGRDAGEPLNHPANVSEPDGAARRAISIAVAGLVGHEPDDIAKAAYQNAEALFPARPPSC